MNAMLKFYLKRGVLVFFIAVFVAITTSISCINTLRRVNHYSENILVTDNLGNTEFQGAENLKWSISSLVDSLSLSYSFLLAILIISLFYAERNKGTSRFIASLPNTKTQLYFYKSLTIYLSLLAMAVVTVLIIYLFYKGMFAEYKSLYIDFYKNNTGVEPFMATYMPHLIKTGISNFCSLILVSTVFNLIQQLTGKPILSLICIFTLFIAILGGLYGLENFLELFMPYTRFTAKYTDFISTIMSTPKYSLAIAVVLFIAGFVVSTYCDGSRNGSLFLFKPLEYIALVVCTITGAFCAYQFLHMCEMLNFITLTGAIIVLIFGGIFSFVITRKIINLN